LAREVGGYVRDHFESVTGCGADHACVQDYVLALAERAFRRPPSEAELAALRSVLERAEQLDAPPEEAAEYGVYAVLESPHFLYRTEFGEPLESGELRLTDYELASALAYLLTSAPPDAELLKAADAGVLRTEDGLAASTDRLLAKPETQRFLERLMDSYFQLGVVPSVVIADAGVTAAHKQAMVCELRGLLRDTLWRGPVSGLLTSREALVNPLTADFYGIPAAALRPPLDAEGFARVTLPEERAGLLTRLGVLTMTSRPDQGNLIGRGLFVRNLITCDDLPPDLVEATSCSTATAWRSKTWTSSVVSARSAKPGIQ
jgi:hypothetical protein